MPHYRTFQDPTEWLGPQDFPSPKTVTIGRVEKEQVDGPDGKKSAMVFYFTHKGKELKRKLQVPKSVAYALSLHFDTPDTDQWLGKDITLYATRCLAFGQVEECVRIQVGEHIDKQVKSWLKKRRVSPRVYIDTKEGVTHDRPSEG